MPARKEVEQLELEQEFLKRRAESNRKDACTELVAENVLDFNRERSARAVLKTDAVLHFYDSAVAVSGTNLPSLRFPHPGLSFWPLC